MATLAVWVVETDRYFLRFRRPPLFEVARVLVRFDHVAHFTRSAAELEGLSQQLKLNKAILKR
jgi:hypothetical protein